MLTNVGASVANVAQQAPALAAKVLSILGQSQGRKEAARCLWSLADSSLSINQLVAVASAAARCQLDVDSLTAFISSPFESLMHEAEVCNTEIECFVCCSFVIYSKKYFLLP